MTARPVKHREEHILIVTDGKGHREIRLQDDLYSMGRGAQCHILLQSQFVSRHHATLVRRKEEDHDYYRIIDGDKVVFGPQVEAVYEYREYDIFPTIPPDDPYDITLIDPAMIDDEEFD